ncbi:MAG: CvpA family protein [Tepidiformaceae bacterium]
MNWVSIVLLAVIGWMTWRAYSTGFIRELVSLGAVIIAVPVAGILYDDLGVKIEPIVDSPNLANLIGFLGILFGVVIAGMVVAHLLKRTVTLLNLGWADDWAGAAFGFLKAVVLCQVVLLALVVFPKPDVRDDINDSFVAGALLDSAPVMLALLPGRFEDGLDRFLDQVDGATETARERLGLGDESNP